jgi:hypothetical protein
MSKAEDVVDIASGEIRLWKSQRQSICIKAVTANGDPVELGIHELNELIRELKILKSRLD